MITICFTSKVERMVSWADSNKFHTGWNHVKSASIIRSSRLMFRLQSFLHRLCWWPGSTSGRCISYSFLNPSSTEPWSFQWTASQVWLSAVNTKCFTLEIAQAIWECIGLLLLKSRSNLKKLQSLKPMIEGLTTYLSILKLICCVVVQKMLLSEFTIFIHVNPHSNIDELIRFVRNPFGHPISFAHISTTPLYSVIFYSK